MTDVTRIPVVARIDDFTLTQSGFQAGLSDSAVDYLRYFDSIDLVLHVDDDGSVLHVELPEFGDLK